MENQSKEHLIEEFRSSYHVGWRKGVDDAGSSRIWRVLHKAAFNESPIIRNIFDEHLDRVGAAAVDCLLSGGDAHAVAVAMRVAACEALTVSGEVLPLQPMFHGAECIKSMLPIEFEDYGRKTKLDIDEDGDMRFFRQESGDEEWRSYQYLGADKLDLPGLLLITLSERVPAVREYFSDQLSQDLETKIVNEIVEASRAVTEEGWLAIATYCLF